MKYTETGSIQEYYPLLTSSDVKVMEVFKEEKNRESDM